MSRCNSSMFDQFRSTAADPSTVEVKSSSTHIKPSEDGRIEKRRRISVYSGFQDLHTFKKLTYGQ